MTGFNLIMPMAGSGSRFNSMGFNWPKPLITLCNKPFFWWATKSLMGNTKQNVKLIYIVLKDHVEKYDLENKIYQYFPGATVVKIGAVTNGALETAMLGLDYVNKNLPIIMNDCDHYFKADFLDKKLLELRQGNLDGFLCNFKSSLKQYSYARYGQSGFLIEAVEKIVVSDDAIAGAYAFRSYEMLEKYYQEYKNICIYKELFTSGIFDLMAKKGLKIGSLHLREHISFGTPEEYEAALTKMQTSCISTLC
jgi:NDP-sugar pyrophosphorylase family protein